MVWVLVLVVAIRMDVGGVALWFDLRLPGDWDTGRLFMCYANPFLGVEKKTYPTHSVSAEHVSMFSTLLCLLMFVSQQTQHFCFALPQQMARAVHHES